MHLACAGFEFTTLVVIDTDCIGGYKTKYHMITTTTAAGRNGLSKCIYICMDNVSECGDISICWSGIRIMCPSGVTYLSVGPESG